MCEVHSSKILFALHSVSSQYFLSLPPPLSPLLYKQKIRGLEREQRRKPSEGMEKEQVYLSKYELLVETRR